MGKSKSMGKWERKGYEWAKNLNTSDSDGSRNWRGGHQYPNRGQWCFCVKVYRTDAVDSGAVEKALKDKYVLTDAQAAEAVETIGEWLRDDCWESMEECVRFCLYGDESGYRSGYKDDPKKRLWSGGRSGGWACIDWPPLLQNERDLTRDERRQLAKAMRGIGGSIDYALSVEGYMHNAENWAEGQGVETREDAANERERAEFADLAPCGAD